MSVVKVTAKQLKNRKKRAKIAKIVLLVLASIITILYLILSIVYKGGRFTITLDPNFSTESGLIMYEQKDKRNITTRLYAKDIDFMDNISVKWINPDIDNEKDGSHNGQNYIAHTFYLENEGNQTSNYWVECIIDDATRNVDEAIRMMVYLNGKQTIYAKKNYPRPYLTADVVFHNYKFSIYIDPWRNRPDGKWRKIGSGVWPQPDPDQSDKKVFQIKGKELL